MEGLIPHLQPGAEISPSLLTHQSLIMTVAENELQSKSTAIAHSDSQDHRVPRLFLAAAKANISIGLEVQFSVPYMYPTNHVCLDEIRSVDFIIVNTLRIADTLNKS